MVLTYQMEKTLNDNREKVGAVAAEVETAIAEAKKALAEGGVEKLNEAFNQLQTASHKLAEALYQQTPHAGMRKHRRRSGFGSGSIVCGGRRRRQCHRR